MKLMWSDDSVSNLNKAEGEVISTSTKKYCIPLNVPLRNVSMYIVYSERYYLHGINIWMLLTKLGNCHYGNKHAAAVICKKNVATVMCLTPNFAEKANEKAVFTWKMRVSSKSFKLTTKSIFFRSARDKKEWTTNSVKPLSILADAILMLLWIWLVTKFYLIYNKAYRFEIILTLKTQWHWDANKSTGHVGKQVPWI